MRALQSVYIDRDSSKDKLDEQVNSLRDRQKLIEESDLDWGPICIFAEGSVTNGKSLSRFRRGGFVANVAVQPAYFRYHYKTVSPDYSTLRGLELGFIMVSEFAMQPLRAHTYPIFVPNDYLYTEYAKTIPGYEKMEKWEIYAHAINDFLSKEGGFEHNEQALREKVSLQKFVWGHKNEITVNGKTFHWPPGSD